MLLALLTIIIGRLFDWSQNINYNISFKFATFIYKVIKDFVNATTKPVR